MPKAISDPITSRRHILAALSGAALAGGALVVAMPTEVPPIPIIKPGADASVGVSPTLNAFYAHWRETQRISDMTSDAAIAL